MQKNSTNTVVGITS